MSLISPERFTSLKARVKAECARRKYTGSVASYAGTDYDYTVTPTSDENVITQHYTKIQEPISAINGDPVLSGERKIVEAELTTFESTVSSLESKSQYCHTLADSGCAASCTGLCYSCTGSCYGCGGCDGYCDGCSGCGGCGGCSGCGGCDSTCSGGCDSCLGSCSGNCYAGCDGGCGGGCSSCTGCSGGARS